MNPTDPNFKLVAQRLLTRLIESREANKPGLTDEYARALRCWLSMNDIEMNEPHGSELATINTTKPVSDPYPGTEEDLAKDMFIRH